MSFVLGSDDNLEQVIDALNYVLVNLGQGNTLITDTKTGQVINPVTGQVVSYLYQYINVRYATSSNGLQNFSQSPTNATYYGLQNTNSQLPVQPDAPQNYQWYQATPQFGTSDYLWYSTIGGRQILWQVNSGNPGSGWRQVADGVAINLDELTNGAVTTNLIGYSRIPGNPTPTGVQLTVNGETLPTQVQSNVTWNLDYPWYFNDPDPSSTDSLYITNGTYFLATQTTVWNTPYNAQYNVAALSQISPNLGTVTSGNITGNVTIATTGNITGNIFQGNALRLANIQGANVVGTVPFANVVTYPTQLAITQVGDLVDLTVLGPIDSNPSYGQVWSTVTQTAAANVATAVTYNTADTSNHNVTVGAGSRIIINRTGPFNIQFSAQVDQTGGGTHEIFLWLRKNGVDVPATGGNFTINSSTEVVVGWNLLTDIVAGDYIQIMWATPDASVTLAALPAQTVPYARPASPSIIVTVTPVGAN